MLGMNNDTSHVHICICITDAMYLYNSIKERTSQYQQASAIVICCLPVICLMLSWQAAAGESTPVVITLSR